MFYVKRWDNDEIVYRFKKLAIAKRYAHGMGHTGDDEPIFEGYPPIAYVADEEGDLVYNPYFSKQIGGAVSGLITAQPSDHF